MTGTITTAMLTSFKSDMYSALDCFNATVTPTGTTTSGNFTVTAVSSLTGLAVGMSISDTGHSGIPAGAVIASIDSSTQITVSKAATASNTATALSASGDAFKIALIKSTPTGSYSATTTNYTDVTGNSDELAASGGYSTGGTALTNVSPTTSGTTALVDFTPDPSWSSATFSALGCIIYNNSRRGPVATRAISVHDFGGIQTVSAGTFTVVMPNPDSSNAVSRIS